MKLEYLCLFCILLPCVAGASVEEAEKWLRSKAGVSSGKIDQKKLEEFHNEHRKQKNKTFTETELLEAYHRINGR